MKKIIPVVLFFAFLILSMFEVIPKFIDLSQETDSSILYVREDEKKEVKSEKKKDDIYYKELIEGIRTRGG